MGYRVTAPSVTVFAPLYAGAQLHTNVMVREGFPLPDGVKPHIIANLLAAGQIEETEDD
jgi:hypothetical protein